MLPIPRDVELANHNRADALTAKELYLGTGQRSAVNQSPKTQQILIRPFPSPFIVCSHRVLLFTPSLPSRSHFPDFSDLDKPSHDRFRPISAEPPPTRPPCRKPSAPRKSRPTTARKRACTSLSTRPSTMSRVSSMNTLVGRRS